MSSRRQWQRQQSRVIDEVQAAEPGAQRGEGFCVLFGESDAKNKRAEQEGRLPPPPSPLVTVSPALYL
ncbi:hypothetical protein E2562_038117 [Oryza meyeriana var. granulata]|uniref:Uncharacterized protein n=1 Tax=Oryza meyeriana var. granulata TaxID=110450 RepID=A0A6G1C410_9ORYZ|nr:hypothetical protein E2562_038117 [Oryza meyeriana var. granulata]